MVKWICDWTSNHNYLWFVSWLLLHRSYLFIATLSHLPVIGHRGSLTLIFRGLLERLQWTVQGPGCLFTNSSISCILTELLSMHCSTALAQQLFAGFDIPDGYRLSCIHTSPGLLLLAAGFLAYCRGNEPVFLPRDSSCCWNLVPVPLAIFVLFAGKVRNYWS